MQQTHTLLRAGTAIAALTTCLSGAPVMAGNPGQSGSEPVQHARSCQPGGPYIGVIPGATSFIMNVIPLDPLGHRLSLVIDTTGDADPTARGLFPAAIGQSHPTGFATRDARGHYSGQLVRYRYDSTAQVVATEIQLTGITQQDCNTLEIAFVGQRFYYGFANPGEDLPPPDIEPDVSGAPAFAAHRMRTIAP